jgi:hypothetical protein
VEGFVPGVWNWSFTSAGNTSIPPTCLQGVLLNWAQEQLYIWNIKQKMSIILFFVQLQHCVCVCVCVRARACVSFKVFVVV